MDPFTRRRAAALALVLLAFLPCVPAEVDGQRREDPALDHARACVGELGWRAPDDAYAAIVEVHVRRASRVGVRPETMARAYSAAVRRPPRHRTWVPQLEVGRRPPAWPPRLPWARYERRFAEVLTVVRATLAGERAEACPEALHYGSAFDPHPRGFDVACSWPIGRGAQVFYAPAAATSEGS